MSIVIPIWVFWVIGIICIPIVIIIAFCAYIGAVLMWALKDGINW